MHGDRYQFVSSWSSFSKILPNLFWLYSVFISALFCIACFTRHAPDNSHGWSNLGPFLSRGGFNRLQQAVFPSPACRDSCSRFILFALVWKWLYCWAAPKGFPWRVNPQTVSWADIVPLVRVCAVKLWKIRICVLAPFQAQRCCLIRGKKKILLSHVFSLLGCSG